MAVTDDAMDAPVLPGPFGAASVAVSALQGLDLDALSPEELNEAVVAFQQLRARVDAADARLVARWDAVKAWRLDGAKTAAAWIAWRTRLPVEEARRRVRHARAVRDLPALGEAWAAGEIDRAHVTTILGARNQRTAERFMTDHAVLLEAARIQGFVDFTRTRDRWVSIVDPDGAEQHADHQRAAREVHLSKSIGGMWFGRTTLDPISGEIVGTTLAHIDDELFRADWAAAKERLGRDPLIVELDRSPAQRRPAATTTATATGSDRPTGTPTRATPPSTTSTPAPTHPTTEAGARRPSRHLHEWTRPTRTSSPRPTATRCSSSLPATATPEPSIDPDDGTRVRPPDLRACGVERAHPARAGWTGGGSAGPRARASTLRRPGGWRR